MKPENKIYTAYFFAQKTQLYFNEIKELTSLSDSSLSLVLKRMVLEKILIRTETKSNTFYTIQNKKIVALKFSEIAVRKFNQLHIDVRYPLAEFLKNLPQKLYSVVLFGSASVNKEEIGSDIDLLFISDIKYDFSQILKDVNALSNFPLSIFSCTPKDFQKNNDHIIIQVKKTGFPISGEQYFYETLLNETDRLFEK